MEGERSDPEDPTQGNLRQVRRHYEAYAAEDLDALLAGCDEKVAITVHDERGKAAGEVIRGKDGARAFFEGIYAAVSDTTVEIDWLRADGDRVLANVALGGISREDGISGSIPAIHFFRFADGLICEIRTYRPDWRSYNEAED